MDQNDFISNPDNPKFFRWIGHENAQHNNPVLFLQVPESEHQNSSTVFVGLGLRIDAGFMRPVKISCATSIGSALL